MSDAKPLPIVPFLKTGADGKPFLEKTVCSKCNAVYFDPPMACPKCFARDSFKNSPAPAKGELRKFSIVHRSFPGAETPFISAVVAFEGGGVLKGNLVGVDTDPAKIKLGSSVETSFKIAPKKDKEGNEYLMYCFKPC
jgi:uncharacterized OB-fold protein